jgi:hypothetical protein
MLAWPNDGIPGDPTWDVVGHHAIRVGVIGHVTPRYRLWRPA